MGPDAVRGEDGWVSTMTNPHQALPFDCPNCATELPAGSRGCDACGIRLTGPLAYRLWSIGQEVERLTRERDALRTRLLAPPDAEEQRLTAPTAPTPAPSGPPAPPGSAQYVPLPAAGHRGGWSGQQVLLGIGALLLLSGAAFFIAVVWSLIGVAGQSLVMLTLTGLAAMGAVIGTRRRMPASAETAAVIATGLVLLDLAAAHALGLFGLDRLDGATYWSGAGLLGAAVLAGFDAVLPRTVDGAPARRMAVYRPAATTLACVALWNLLAFGPDHVRGAAAVGLALALTLLSAGVMVGSYLLDPPVRGSFRPSMVPPVMSTGVAFLSHLVLAVGTGWTPGTVAERYGAMGLVLVVPAVALALVAWGPVAGRSAVRVTAYGVAAVGLFVAAGVPAAGASPELLAVVALLLGVGVGALLWRPLVGVGARSVAVAWGLTAVVSLGLLVAVLDLAGAPSAVAAQAGGHVHHSVSSWIVALPALGFAVAAAAAAVSRRSVEWTVLAMVASYTWLWIGLQGEETTTLWAVVLPLALVHVAAAAAVCWIGRVPDGGGSRPVKDADAFEFVAAGGAVLLGLVVLVVAPWVGVWQNAGSWLLFGVAALAYAALPGRLGVAYAGTVLVSWGAAILLDDAGVRTVEAYTATAVVVLAVIGVTQCRRRPEVRTLVSAGPALAVGVLPSLWVGVEGDDVVRLVLVTVVGLALLVAGLARAWQAPALVGLVVLVVVAWTQGAPLVEYVPNFVLLMGAGAVALAVGVAWEAAVRAGRRGIVWFAGLR